MHLQLVVFLMAIVPAYLNNQYNINQPVRFSTQSNQTNVQEQESLDDTSNLNYSCPNNKVLLNTLNILKENIIENVNLTLSPNKFQQVLDKAIKYLKSTRENDVDTDINHALDLKRVIENLNHRPKKEAFRSYPQPEISSETLKGKITLQYDLPTTGDPDCKTLFNDIVNAINVAYLQLNNFCIESGKCYAQNEYSSPSLNTPHVIPGSMLPQIENIPPSNKFSNRFNVIGLGSYPQNGDVTTLLQNYRPNTQKATKGSSWSISAPTSIQGNVLNPIKDNMKSGNISPDSLSILQSFNSNYIDMIKNHGLPTLQEELQINSYGVPQNDNLWTFQHNIKPNGGTVNTKENMLQFATHVGNNVENNLDNAEWNDLTGYQGVMEILTVLNQPTGYMSRPAFENSLTTPSGALNFNNMPFLVNNNTAQISQSHITPQFNTKPVDNFGVITKNFSELTANIPWQNNLRLNGNVPSFPYNYNKNFPAFQEVNLPYKTTDQSLDNVPNFQDNAFNFKPPINVPSGLPHSNFGKGYYNHNYFDRMNPIYYPDATYNANINLPNSNTVVNRQIPHLNWYQKLKTLNNVPIMENIPSTFGPNQLPMIVDNISANHQQGNISKKLSDLYPLTMSNEAKLNIAPNKNGIVELTFTLQRPQSLVYNPLYYVKYRLPYQTYLYNVQNLLKTRPLLRTEPNKLHQELLNIANISETSHDLKTLTKDEISKLVATNGALVKAKVLDESSNENKNTEGDVDSVIHLSTNLNPKDILNTTKKTLNNVEKKSNTAHLKMDVHVVNETSKDIPVKF